MSPADWDYFVFNDEIIFLYIDHFSKIDDIGAMHF